MTSTTPPSQRAGVVTRLLQEASSDDLVERLLPLVYDELRMVARAQRHRSGPATLATTALVHEAYLRLVGSDMVPNRRYFFAAAARAMRNVLVDHARRRSAKKRGRPVTLNTEVAPGGIDLDMEAVRVLDVHAALDRLAAFDERAAQVVECRFFGGLSVEETAEVVNVGTATVKRDWRRARAWLETQLAEGRDPSDDETANGGHDLLSNA
ncbi:MAG: ECF-type sigma factor [Bacteroidota bacterium]